MGQNASNPKPKQGKKVNAQKIATARSTGVLSLRESGLKSVPEAVWEVANLKTLDLTANEVRALDERVAGLGNLKTLHLASNRLQACPPLDALGKLQTLSLDGNRLAEVPPLPASLRALTLAGNALEGRLADSLWACVALETLDLARVGLVELPEAVGALARLTELVLDDNALEALPEALAALPRLTLVSARNNRLGAYSGPGGGQSVPAAVLQAGNVNQLRLEGNGLTKQQFLAFDGVQGFLDRHTRSKRKELQGGVDSTLSIAGLG